MSSFEHTPVITDDEVPPRTSAPSPMDVTPNSSPSSSIKVPPAIIRKGIEELDIGGWWDSDDKRAGVFRTLCMTGGSEYDTRCPTTPFAYMCIKVKDWARECVNRGDSLTVRASPVASLLISRTCAVQGFWNRAIPVSKEDFFDGIYRYFVSGAIDGGRDVMIKHAESGDWTVKEARRVVKKEGCSDDAGVSVFCEERKRALKKLAREGSLYGVHSEAVRMGNGLRCAVVYGDHLATKRKAVKRVKET